MAGTWTAWTVTSLAAHIRGEINSDADAAGGTVPDRYKTLCRAAATELWTMHDWDFRRKLGSLATVASTETYSAPTDFAEIDQKWLCDRDTTKYQLRFTTDPTSFQRDADEYESTDTDAPRTAIIYWDDTANAIKYRLTPIPDAVYTYPYWYLTADPFTQGSQDDSTAMPWPKHFDEGWRLLSRAMCKEAFASGDEAAAEQQRFGAWLKRQITERASFEAEPGSERIQDGYDDLRHLTTTGGVIWR